MRRLTADIATLRFNTAIAALMTLVGRLRGAPADPEVSRSLVSLLAPFAPHLAEELWSRCGQAGSVHRAPWPAV